METIKKRNHSGLKYIGTTVTLAVALTVAVAVAARIALAQFSPQRNYADYYKRNLDRYRRPSANPARYTFDRMYYHNPAISPYLNLLRPNSSRLPNYQAFVRPEIQRRQRQSVSSMDLGVRSFNPAGTGYQPRAISRPTSSSRPGNYYRHWFGRPIPQTGH